MKKLLSIAVIFMTICSVFVNGQSNQPKLNQVELSKKLIGVWQEQVLNDTIPGFEMTLYKDAVQETWFRTVRGVKELLGTSSFIYDPRLDKFKGYFIIPNGQLTYYYFKFSSDKEVVFERVKDFNSNKLMARNKFVLPDEDHINGTHYNENEVQYNTSKWIKINSGGAKALTMKESQTDIKNPQLNQLELAKKLIGVWQVEGKKDTIPGLEFEQYGNTIMASDILITNGKKVAHDKISFGFSKSQNMFKIFFLFPSGGYSTRNAYFTSENRFVQEFVQDFNSEKLVGTAEFIIESATKMTARSFNQDGKLAAQGKLIKMQ